MVLGCDPQDRRLWKEYDILVDWAIRLMVETPESIVSREGALDPGILWSQEFFAKLRNGATVMT